MNLTEFLEELSKTRNGWSIIGSRCIRKTASRREEHCPVTAVCSRLKKVRLDTGEYEEAGNKLGLPGKLTQRIADAADTLTMEPRLRARLLRAVGLK